MADAPCILIVDDAAVLRGLIRTVLERKGFRTLQAENAEAALEIARQTPPDLVLMDLEMPGMNGIEGIRAFRADPRLAHLPVVAVTGNSDLQTKSAARAAGAEGYLVKDEKLRDRLAETIQRYLRSHALALAQR
ncbi:MAG: response regulator [Planctomycetales bacterium]